MRGAQPDAVCPRCDHHQPPAETLAHCARCGLTFQPKELLVRSRSPTRREPEPFALETVPPKTLTVEHTNAELRFRWSEHPEIGFTALGIALVMVRLMWIADVSSQNLIKWTAILSGIVALAFVQARRTVQVAVDRERIRALGGTLLLADVQRVYVDGGWVVARTRYDKFFDIARTSDLSIAAFVGAELAKRVNPD